MLHIAQNTGFPYVLVDLDQIRENLFSICAKTSKKISQVIAVVKDNAYGLGAGAVSKMLQNEGVKHFAVATIDEAVFLRKNEITGDILVLGYTNEADFEVAQNLNLTLSIVDTTQLKHIKKTQKIKWHINIDTGMHRDGILSEDIIENIELKNKLSDLSPVISGVYTHYHSSDSEEQTSVKIQQEKFRVAVSELKNAGMAFEIIHTSNSGAVAYSAIDENEFIRPGVLLYGCRPDPKQNPNIDIKEAAKIYSKIVSIRKIKSGEGVSYGHSYIAPKDTQIATIAIGYADGFPRAVTACPPTVESHPAAGSHFVVKHLSELFPVVGRITMDYIMLDIGDSTNVNIGDTVALADSIDELAIKAGTIGYELLCKFGGLMNRKYLKNGQIIGQSIRELY